MSFDLAAYMNEANARIAEADNKAFASGLAFARGPEAFQSHLTRTMDADLENLYEQLGYSTAASEAGRPDSTTGEDSGQAVEQ